MKTKFSLLNRREFMTRSALASAGFLIGQSAFASPPFNSSKPNSKIAGVQLGVITYSFRSMPSSAEQLLQYCMECNINAIELIGDAAEDYAGRPENAAKFAAGQPLTDAQKEQLEIHKKQVADWRANVSMDKFDAFRKLYNQAGVTIYAFKPRACLEPTSTDGEIEYAMKAAKALGANAVTVELPRDASHSKRLGEFATKHKVFVGYHAHTQATDTAWEEALTQSAYNSLNLDCGHYIAAGGNNTKESLLKLIEKKADRITSLHLKDRKSKINGQANMPWGQGETPIKEILLSLKNNKYKFPATIELEYDIPAGSTAVAETKRCLAYATKVLTSS